jgi:hypothetical protein
MDRIERRKVTFTVKLLEQREVLDDDDDYLSVHNKCNNDVNLVNTLCTQILH